MQVLDVLYIVYHKCFSIFRVENVGYNRQITKSHFYLQAMRNLGKFECFMKFTKQGHPSVFLSEGGGGVYML